MKQVHLHGKSFDEADFRRLVIGGQTNADTIRFVVPRRFSDELDFSTDDWVFSISYENKEGQGDTVVLNKSLSSGSEANLYLDWKPSQTATQVPGKLTCQVTAVSKGPDDEIVSRFTCAPFAVYVEEWINPDPITQALPTVIEQALELMSQYVGQLEEGIEAGKQAVESAKNAAASEINAKKSEDAAAESERNSKASEEAAKKSEEASAESQRNAATSEENASQSASNAAESEQNASTSETNAKKSEESAAESENNAKASEEAAKKSEDAAAESQRNAATSEENASQSASNAAESERNASTSETNAKTSEDAAAESENNAKASEEAAKKSEDAAAESESNAATSEQNAAASEEASDASARLAERYATGSEGGVPVEDGAGYEDNAEFYKELAAQARSDTEELKEEAAQYVDEGKRIFDEIGPVAQDALDKIAQLETKVEEVMQMRRAWSQTIGDGTTKVFVLRHNLLSYDYIAQVWSNAENHPSRWRMEKTDLNTVTIRFDTAPPQDGITVSIIGIDEASVGTVDWQDVKNVMVTAEQLAPENALTTEEIKAAFDARK